jgi:hypothetical protein
MVERVIIGDSFIMHEVPGRETYHHEQDCPNHQAAIDLLIQTVTDPVQGVLKNVSEISAVGHRVVHGGEKFTCSVMIDEQVLNAVKEVQHLAPLHNPPNIEGIEAAQALMPTIPHVAIFDTAFHQTMPEHAYIYPLPYEWYEKYQVRRYGFHGTSHLYVSKRAAVLLNKQPKDCNIVTMHIGNGVSHCAIVSLHDAELHQQIFQFFHLQLGGNDQHLVVVYLLRQGSVFLSLGMFWGVFDDGHPSHLRPLNLIITGYEMNHLGAEFSGQGRNQFKLLVGLPGIADQSCQTDLA